ncbi:MAG: hypothetical protein KIC54_06535 [Clostridium sp.]|nr:hypothetical protein [Clostridium sp.]
MKFKNESIKRMWKQTEPSTAKSFAEIWATELEVLLIENENAGLEDVAFRAFNVSLKKADKENLKIGGTEEYAALGLLGQYWYMGNELYQLWTEGSIIPNE